MADAHLNFGLGEEDHKTAKEVKKAMKSSNWAECFMELIKAEKVRINL